jgi:anaerobic dimethyl sulfoxide reductase subunit C (anchor subunit)
MKERSLVAFSILAQMAVGAFWVSGALGLWEPFENGADLALLIAPSCMALGLLASFFHLGAPLNAWRAFANLRSSWLSREILCATLFMAASSLLTGSHYFELGSAAAREAVARLAALLGLALLYSMTNAYRLRTVPAWDTRATAISFFTTALLLGGLAVGAALAVEHSAPADGSALRWIAGGSIVLLATQLATVTLWTEHLASQKGAAARAAAKIMQEHSLIFRLQLALAMLAMLVAAIILLPWVEGAVAKSATILTFVLALISEVLGRALFYEARVRHGV